MRPVVRIALAACALAGAALPAAGAEAAGEAVFAQYCVHCHGPGPEPGTLQLGLTRGAGKALLTERTDLAPEYIEAVVRRGLRAMPPFVPSDLTDAKLQALVDYLTP